MLQPEQLKNFFPAFLWENPSHRKYILKEYLQLLMLDYLSNSKYVKNITFIGGTNLRLIKGIDRFSEDLDFDCKALDREMFLEMTNAVVAFLANNGYRVETRDKKNDKLIAFRRNIYFPEFLFELGLSAYKQERFLIKIESQDQKIAYKNKMAPIKGCGMYFPFPVPEDDVLCSMKLSALLSRQKGRDFYDCMFLLSQTTPNYQFLNEKHGISNLQELKAAIFSMLENINLKNKSKDFEHLVFNQSSANKILHFREFINEL